MNNKVIIPITPDNQLFDIGEFIGDRIREEFNSGIIEIDRTCINDSVVMPFRYIKQWLYLCAAMPLLTQFFFLDLTLIIIYFLITCVVCTSITIAWVALETRRGIAAKIGLYVASFILLVEVAIVINQVMSK